MFIKNFESFNISNVIKNLMFNSPEIDGFTEALEKTYGNIIPLYHATTEENAQIIDEEGFKLTDGVNYKSFSSDKNLYFQIGKSDYVSVERPVLYRYDTSLEFIAKYAFADLDGIDISDNDLIELGLDPEFYVSEMRDFICSFIQNNYSFEGMELLIMNIDNDPNFPVIKPVRLN